jgi:hypothetical protein
MAFSCPSSFLALPRVRVPEPNHAIPAAGYQPIDLGFEVKLGIKLSHQPIVAKPVG